MAEVNFIYRTEDRELHLRGASSSANAFPPELREDIYPDNDNQVQSNEDIGYQDPMPPDVETLELSWDRKKAFMRIIIKDKGTWYFKELMGKAQVLSADSEKGRLYLRAIPFLDKDDTLYLARDPDSVPHEPIEEEAVAELLRTTNNRLCYSREGSCWRIRDERKPWMDDTSRRLVADYIGDIAIEWNRRCFNKSFPAICMVSPTAWSRRVVVINDRIIRETSRGSIAFNCNHPRIRRLDSCTSKCWSGGRRSTTSTRTRCIGVSVVFATASR